MCLCLLCRKAAGIWILGHYKGNHSISGNLPWYCIYDSLCSNPCYSAALRSHWQCRTIQAPKKLGVEHREPNRALFIQILSYYLLPLLLAVIHSVVGLTVASREVIKVFGDMNVASTILVTSIFIVFVYGSYFLLTYVGSKSVINKG